MPTITFPASITAALWTHSDISLFLDYPMVDIGVDEFILRVNLDHLVTLFSESSDNPKN
jgi:hypothetical protein